MVSARLALSGVIFWRVGAKHEMLEKTVMSAVQNEPSVVASTQHPPDRSPGTVDSSAPPKCEVPELGAPAVRQTVLEKGLVGLPDIAFFVWLLRISWLFESHHRRGRFLGPNSCSTHQMSRCAAPHRGQAQRGQVS